MRGSGGATASATTPQDGEDEGNTRSLLDVMLELRPIGSRLEAGHACAEERRTDAMPRDEHVNEKASAL